DRYKLTVLLLENDIIGYQADYTNGAHNDFVHNKVVRAAITNVSGTACVVDLNAPKTYSFSVTVPDEYDPGNLEVLAYIQRPFGQQPVIQSGDYGSNYVDNCYAAPVGATTLPDLK
ncbi:MAG: Omp28-related outer membrane protein, partial [Bacteroidales bacterium]|nr:Omp28-related outer membrane protein [Bacteroidales bacterium]